MFIQLLRTALVLCDAQPLSDITSLGATGLIGAMWLWERRASANREQQLDEAHQRILADKVQLEALVDLIRQNTEALTRLLSSAVIEKPEEHK